MKSVSVIQLMRLNSGVKHFCIQTKSEGFTDAHTHTQKTTIIKANPLLVSSDTVVQMGTEKNTSAEEDNNFFSNSMTLALMFHN